MKKLVNGILVDLTPQEILIRQAEEKAWSDNLQIREWENKISASALPRYVEDIIDALDAVTKAKIAKETLDLYQEKKTIRAEKPLEQNK